VKDWKDLLETAIEILEKAGIKAEDWTFGGGTALMLYFHHRKSKDIDIFLSNPLKKRFQHIKSKEKEINLSDLQLEKPVVGLHSWDIDNLNNVNSPHEVIKFIKENI